AYTCGNITDAIYCTDALEDTATGLTIGNTYYIQVYSHVANANTTFDICVSTNEIPGQTYVPDDNFEQALIDLGYDITLDDYVTTTNISGIQNVNISSENISDLTGIEDFTALQNLNASGNQLTSIDVTQNTALTLLNLDNNSISEIDLTQNIALESVYFHNNSLITVDITQNTMLFSASFQANQLTTIDVSQNIALQSLYLAQNLQLSTLDISTNTNLIVLDLNFTQISNLQVSNNSNLDTLILSNSPLTNIDVSDNLALRVLNLNGAPIQQVDVSNNTALERLFVNGCSNLTGTNIQNGNNTNINTFHALNTPNLACVQVDDVAYSTANWTVVDAGTNFSTDCGFLENDECVNAINIPISDGTCNNVISATMVNATNS
ncbi:leucine-rich repeat domain-containing protein, partial [Kordia jejudonensis]|uniref:leucine-rich repeat domain-containing protein n=1 Tax=Kordia jejudonensis TaxID=1348245 RepID=UPI00062942B6